MNLVEFERFISSFGTALTKPYKYESELPPLNTYHQFYIIYVIIYVINYTYTYTT